MLDVIGDVHGYAKNLVDLLLKLNYTFNNGTYSHPESRKVVFIGDYIDRGSNQEDVLNIVKGMVESGNAYALMGNHEYNAICFAEKINGEYLREHSSKNVSQHQDFLNEYSFGSEKHISIIEWFKTLPLFLEIRGARFVHAAWINSDISHLKSILNPDNTIKNCTYKNLSNESHPDYKSIETILKGVEREIPNGFTWTDLDGHSRTATRLNWFTPVENPTFRNSALSIPDHVILPELPIESYDSYKDDIIVFFGHYWMSGEPRIQGDYSVCVDYSVAKKGSLVAYRFNNEKISDSKNFIF